jgi:DNA-binding ferritin-like protein
MNKTVKYYSPSTSSPTKSYNKQYNNKSKKNTVSSFSKTILWRFLHILETVKLYHWNTRIYSQHKITDELYDKLNKNIDLFVEVFLGKKNEHLVATTRSATSYSSLHSHYPPSISKTYFTKINTHIFIKELYKFKDFLVKLNKYVRDIPENSDLFNIRDEIMADIEQTLYIFKFK